MFSNGPDNASLIAPDDVRAVAEDDGIPIYVISTNDVSKDPTSSDVFKRISTRTGGKSYFAKTWQKQVEAFESIREDLGNSYTITYYPAAESQRGIPQDQRRNRERCRQEVSRARAARLSPARRILSAALGKICNVLYVDLDANIRAAGKQSRLKPPSYCLVYRSYVNR